MSNGLQIKCTKCDASATILLREQLDAIIYAAESGEDRAAFFREHYRCLSTGCTGYGEIPADAWPPLPLWCFHCDQRIPAGAGEICKVCKKSGQPTSLGSVPNWERIIFLGLALGVLVVSFVYIALDSSSPW